MAKVVKEKAPTRFFILPAERELLIDQPASEVTSVFVGTAQKAVLQALEEYYGLIDGMIMYEVEVKRKLLIRNRPSVEEI